MRLVLLACLLFAACASPSPRFLGQVPWRVSAGGHDFLIYRDGGVAEVLRTNAASDPDAAHIAEAAAHAVSRASGCEVAWLRGDAAIIRMGLACGAAEAPPPPDRPLILDCETLDVYTPRDSELSDITLECAAP